MGKKHTANPPKEDVEIEQYEDQIDSDEEAAVMESKLATIKTASINNTEAILERLEDMRTNLPFIETFQVEVEAVSEDLNANDDLKREVNFYTQALEGVKIARKELTKLKVPHMRPVDYFAEMVKSDEHMARIKQKLLFEKQKMDAFEQRKKSQEYKKYSKQLQAEKLKDKTAKKKKAIEDAKQLKGIMDKNKDDEELLNKWSRAGKRKRDGDDDGKRRTNKKRDAKDKKFGFGGRKRGSKRNTAESSNDTSEYSGKRNRSLPSGMSAGKKGGKRPGKARRNQMRSRR